MRIEKITDQHRRDFSAVMICEHCGTKDALENGYDDANYHQNVIPKMVCKICGRSAAEDYKPMGTKYPDGVQV